MDTDDLTEMAYETIIIANEITEFLKCDLGVRSRDYEDENTYLKGILKFIQEIKSAPEGYLDHWNLWKKLDPGVFVKEVAKLEEHIKNTLETPIEHRG